MKRDSGFAGAAERVYPLQDVVMRSAVPPQFGRWLGIRAIGGFGTRTGQP
jgi:hypothetical protein